MLKTGNLAAALALFVGLTGASASFAQDTTEAAPTPPAGPNWLVSCSNQANPDQLTCNMTQSVILVSTGDRILTAIVQPVNGGHQLAFVLPFGLDLKAGVNLVLDGSPWQSIPVNTCDAGACYTRLALDAKMLSALSGGKELNVQLTNTQGQGVALSLTLDGFTKSLNLTN